MQRSTDASPTSRSQRSEKSLTGEVRLVENLSQNERGEMFSLMARYFSNVSRTVFERDLSEKEWCILLTDASGHVKGFSTMMRDHPFSSLASPARPKPSMTPGAAVGGTDR